MKFNSILLSKNDEWGEKTIEMGNRALSNNIDTRKRLIAHRVGSVTDWGGQALSKKIFDMLEVGDFVRVQIEATEEAVQEAKKQALAAKMEDDACGKNDSLYVDYFGGVVAPYFEIVKIKDGTFWGKAKNVYGTISMFGVLKEDEVFTFRKENIIEVPIDWIKNKRRRNQMEKYVQPGNKGKGITGVEI